MAEVLSVEFKPAKGGLISETHSREAAKSRDGLSEHKHETAIHNTLADAMDHLHKHLGHRLKREKRSKKSGGLRK